MGHIKRHFHGCKSKDQVELTLKNSKPYFSPRMRGKNWSFESYCGVMGPNHTIGFWALAESVSSLSLRRNISSDKLNANRV